MARRKLKGFKPFVSIGKTKTFRKHFFELTPNAQSLYVRLKMEFNGRNNGELTLPYSQLKGYKSTRTIKHTFDELIDRGWIKRCRQGGLFGTSCRYQLTWTFDQWHIEA